MIAQYVPCLIVSAPLSQFSFVQFHALILWQFTPLPGQVHMVSTIAQEQ